MWDLVGTIWWPFNVNVFQPILRIKMYFGDTFVPLNRLLPYTTSRPWKYGIVFEDCCIGTLLYFIPPVTHENASQPEV